MQALSAGSVWLSGVSGSGKSTLGRHVLSRVAGESARVEVPTGLDAEAVVHLFARAMGVGTARGEALPAVLSRVRAHLASQGPTTILVEAADRDVVASLLDLGTERTSLVFVGERAPRSDRVRHFVISPLSEQAARRYVAAALPTLAEVDVDRLLALSEGLPVRLETLCRQVASVGPEILRQARADSSDDLVMWRAAWGSLSEDAKTLIARLAAFDADMGLAVVVAACADLRVAALVEELTRESWVFPTPTDAGTVLRMLSSAREFVRNHHTPLSHNPVSQHLANVAVQCADGIRGRDGLELAQRFDQSRNGVREVVATLRTLTLVGAVAKLGEVLDVVAFDEVVDDAQIEAPSVDAVRVLLHRARRSGQSGRTQHAAELVARANGMAVELDDTALRVELKCHLASATAPIDTDVAREKLAEADALAAELSDGFLDALVRLRRGLLAMQLGMIRDAREHLDAATRLYFEHSNDLYVVDALAASAYASFRLGELTVARRGFECALETYERAGNELRCATTRFNLATVLAAERRHADAVELLERAATAPGFARNGRYQAVAAILRGMILLDLANVPAAKDWFADARSLANLSGDTHTHAVADGMLAVGDFLEGDRELAAARLASALDVVEPPRAVEAVILMRATQARIAGTDDVEMLRAIAARVHPEERYFHRIAAQAVAVFGGDQIEVADSIGIRVLQRIIEATDAASTVRDVHMQRWLRIAPDAVAFHLEGDEVVDISRRQPLRKLLLGLFAGHADDPDRAFTVDELAKIGWPDETLTRSTAKNRVYTAIRFLRACGLEAAIVTTPFGYRFADDLRVEMVAKLE